MAKQTDLEQRLQALEARQNMFMGGFTLPTTYKDPTTGKTMPIPTASVPNIGSTYGSGSTPAVDLADSLVNDPFGSAAANAANSQDNFSNLVNTQNLNTSNTTTPTYDLSGLGIGSIDFSQIPGLNLSQYTGANTQTGGANTQTSGADTLTGGASDTLTGGASDTQTGGADT